MRRNRIGRPRFCRSAVIAGWVCLAGAALAGELPSPDLDGVEAQVGTKVAAFRDQVLQSSNDATAWGRYGMVLEAHGFAEESKIAYGQASSLDPGESRWPYYLAAAYDASDPQRSVDLYLEAIDRAPDYAPARIRVAQTLEKLARDQEAWEHYARAFEIDRENPFGPLGLGLIAMRQGRLEEAVRHLETALELNPRIHATGAGAGLPSCGSSSGGACSGRESPRAAADHLPTGSTSR